MSEKPIFSIIEGGLSSSKKEEKELPKKSKMTCGIFKSAEATRSRLMGVIGMHITCTYDDSTRCELHHFLYLDAEEYGIDNYEILFTSDREEVEAKKTSLFGGLGEPWVELTEKGAMHLLNYYKEFNLMNDIEFPKPFDESFALKIEPIDITEEEIDDTYNAICAPINSDMQLCNYYIMRLCGMDYVISDRLESPVGSFQKLPIDYPSALCSNRIDVDSSEEHSYFCESLIDQEEDFYIAVSRIKVQSQKVTYFEVTSFHQISRQEASLIMNKKDYMIIEQLDDNSPEFRDKVKKTLSKTFSTMTISEYDASSLIMIFNNNNAHVNRLHYRIDNDLSGMIFYTHDGEIVISASSPIKAELIKRRLLDAGLDIKPIGNVSFDHPIMASFLESKMPSFVMFLAYLQK